VSTSAACGGSQFHLPGSWQPSLGLGARHLLLVSPGLDQWTDGCTAAVGSCRSVRATGCARAGGFGVPPEGVAGVECVGRWRGKGAVWLGVSLEEAFDWGLDEDWLSLLVCVRVLLLRVGVRKG
jgi:hypothetical protein